MQSVLTTELPNVLSNIKLMDVNNALSIIKDYLYFPYVFTNYNISSFTIRFKSSLSIHDDYDIDEETSLIYIKLSEDEYALVVKYTDSSNIYKTTYYEINDNKVRSLSNSEDNTYISEFSNRPEYYVFLSKGENKYEIYEIIKIMNKNDFINEVNKEIKHLCRLKRLCRLDRIEIYINEDIICYGYDMDEISNIDKYIREPFEDYMKYD
jgi:hypothetical protein